MQSLNNCIEICVARMSRIERMKWDTVVLKRSSTEFNPVSKAEKGPDCNFVSQHKSYNILS